MIIDELIQELFIRGTTVNPPVNVKEIQRFEVDSGVIIPALHRRLLSTFDGFPNMEYDARSTIRIWPLREHKIVRHGRGNLLLAFSDFSWNSENYLMDLSDENYRICGEFGQEVIADNLNLFWQKFVSGEYDY